MEIAEARAVATQYKNRYRDFEKLEAMLETAVGLEQRIKQMRIEEESLGKKLADLNSRIDAKHVELQEMIDSMVETAERESSKAQDALKKLQDHCHDQMIEIRKKYVEDKKAMEREIGDLNARAAQIQKNIAKFREQEAAVKDQLADVNQQLSTKDHGAINATATTAQAKRELEKVSAELAKVKADYTQEKATASREIGDLRAEKQQLEKSIKQLKTQSVELGLGA